MSDENTARHAECTVEFDGVDITSSIKPYLLSLTFTDNEEDASDDLQIKLQDREGVWMTDWLQKMLDGDVSAASSDGYKVGDVVQFLGGPHYKTSTDKKANGTPKAGPAKITIIKQGALHPYHVIHTDGTSRVYGWVDASEISGKSGGSSSGSSEGGLKIRATITACNWHSDGKDEALDCGEFELDSINASGPPDIITIKATGLPYTSQIRQTKQSKGWEKYKLSGIANEMAKKNGMKSQFLAKKDPEYKRVEQYRCSDIDFLSQLCHDAGLSLKCTDGKLVIFDQKEYEGKDSAWTVTKDDKSYIKWSHTLGQAGTQYASCRVSYVGPNGKPIEGIAYVKDYDAKSKTNQQLEVYAPVTNKTEAKELAAKKLRLHNKFERQVGFTYHGDPGKVAGLTFETKSFGPWDGKYIVKQAKHTVTGSGGYTTQVSGRHVLGGY